MRMPLIGERVQSKMGARYGRAGVVLARYTETWPGVYVATLHTSATSGEVYVNVDARDVVSLALVRTRQED
jgi:hypothetical protein